MLTKLKEFLTARLGADTPPVHSAHGRHLAAAALLIEVARADYGFDPREQLALQEALRRSFDLSHAEIETLLALAEAEAREATSSYAFTRLINEEYSDEEKSDLLRAMWSVAFADGEVDKYEEHLIRKIAGLIYVPHQEFIRTRLQAGAQFEHNRG